MFRHVSAERIYGVTGIQFLHVQFAVSAVRRQAIDAAPARRRDRVRHDSRSAQLLAHRPAVRPSSPSRRRRRWWTRETRTWSTQLLSRARSADAICSSRFVEPGAVIGGIRRRASRPRSPTRRWSRPRVTTPDRPSRRCPRTAAARSSARAPGRSSAPKSARRSSRPGRASSISPTKAASAGRRGCSRTSAGLWLLQACMRRWAEAGQPVVVRRSARRGARRSARVPVALRSGPQQLLPSARHAGRDRRVLPADRSGRAVRTARLRARDSRKPRVQVPRRARVARGADRPPLHDIRIVGGGSRNRLLNQFTADATGRTVLAGPVEATALGNIAMQMLATGTVRSLAEARAHHRTVFPARAIRSGRHRSLDAHYGRFQEYREVMGV